MQCDSRVHDTKILAFSCFTTTKPTFASHHFQDDRGTIVSKAGNEQQTNLYFSPCWSMKRTKNHWYCNANVTVPMALTFLNWNTGTNSSHFGWFSLSPPRRTFRSKRSWPSSGRLGSYAPLMSNRIRLDRNRIVPE